MMVAPMMAVMFVIMVMATMVLMTILVVIIMSDENVKEDSKRDSKCTLRWSENKAASFSNEYSLCLNLILMSALTWAGLVRAREKLKGGPWPIAHTSRSVAARVARRVGGLLSVTCTIVGGRRRGGQSLTSVTVMVSVAVADKGGRPLSTPMILATPSAPPGASRSRRRHSLTSPSVFTLRESHALSTRYSTLSWPSCWEGRGGGEGMGLVTVLLEGGGGEG